MGAKTFNGRFQHLRGTQEEWESKNPVLLDGEKILVVMPNGKVKEKVGDGVKTYSQLSFHNESSSGGNEIPHAYNSTIEVSSDEKVITTTWTENGISYRTVLTDQSTDSVDTFHKQMWINDVLVATWVTTNISGSYITTYTAN